MPLPVVCPLCGKQGSVRQSSAGRKIKCRSCGGFFYALANAGVERIISSEPPHKPTPPTSDGGVDPPRQGQEKRKSFWKAVKFVLVAALFWFPATFGFGVVADAAGIPDTDTWMWILRGAGAVVGACIAWIAVGAPKADAIALTVWPMIGLVTNVIHLLCSLLAVVAVVMTFVKDSKWVYDELYHPLVTPLIAVGIFGLLPTVLLLMIFRKTRILGGISLFLLSSLLAWTLWFYALIVAGSHGPGWVIAGLLMAGIGVIPVAILASVFSGSWVIAGELLLMAVSFLVARFVGLGLAGWQLEKEENEKYAQAK